VTALALREKLADAQHCHDRLFPVENPATCRVAAGGERMTPLIEELWDVTPGAILAVAPDNSILYWNRSAETIFGNMV
jgi:hypothetical protein